LHREGLHEANALLRKYADAIISVEEYDETAEDD
jgi:hypothetical protein